MIKRSIYQKAVTSKNIYTSNIRYLRKMKQILNRHVQITLPKKSRKHMYLKDTENILYERPHVRPKLTILRDWYHKSIFPNNNEINIRKNETSSHVDIKQLTVTPQMALRKKSHQNFKIHGSKRKDNIIKFITHRDHCTERKVWKVKCLQ